MRLSTVGSVLATSDGNAPAELNRLSSDGDILGFYKDGSTVGSIGTPYTGELYIEASGANSSGLTFTSGNTIQPRKNGAADNGNISIGTSGNRFKDLHLSGGVVFGDAGGSGTSTSNSLDSYEEGTWTVTTNVGTISANTGFYTKIGDLVYFTAVVGGFSETASSTNIQLSLPFTSSSVLNNHGSVMSRYVAKSDKSLTAYIGANLDYVNIYANGTNGDNWSALTYSDLTSGSAYLRFSICFKV